MTEWLITLESTQFATWLRESGSIWAYPLVLTLHTTGMGILVGANWVVDLRLLGAGAGIPLGPLARLFKAMWIGFWLNLVTGVMLFAADASTKGTTTVFFVKLVCVVAAVIVAVLMKRSVYGTSASPTVVPPIARTFAVLSILLWLGAITTGRWMAYV
ncbi:MAG: DUF6644 family protein [Vicinamibacterales bacterium]